VNVRRERLSRSDDDGFATVWVAFALVIMLVVLGAALHLGSAVLARQRAENAADLAALAGAARSLDGADAACARAAEVVRANKVQLIDCRMDGMDVLVRVSVQALVWGGLAQGRARAGPA